MVDWFSLTIPLAYLGVLVGSLATFSSLYRKRKAAKAASLEPWFPPNLQRDIYLSLMHMEQPAQSSSGEKKPPAVPETVLKAALLRRATEDIKRVMAIRSQKPALSSLLQKGSVSDDLWQRFIRAEKEMEEEVRDVVSEANAYAAGWGQTIFQSANEIANNTTLRQKVKAQQASVNEEREWWDRKKASIQEGFMKELDEGSSAKDTSKTPAASSTSNSTANNTAAATPAASVSGKSDDDAVLVDSPVPNAQENPAAGTKKKKKGKK